MSIMSKRSLKIQNKDNTIKGVKYIFLEKGKYALYLRFQLKTF